MHPVLPPWRRRPLFRAAATREIERAAIESLPAHTLMQRAGDAVARLALAVSPHARRIWIAAGPGNNGGDGLEAAAQLQRRGKSVVVTLAADATRLPSDATEALSRARGAGVEILDAAAMPDLDCDDMAIDALLGIGASREPQGSLASMIDRLNRLPCPVLAIDVPSGLNVDTGQPMGDACVVAQHTLSLLTLKPGLVTGAGRDHAGSIWHHDLGVPVDSSLPDAWLTGEDDALRPRRRHASHKGSFGDVGVVGGARGMTGAALLAARAAHAAGAGRVFVNLLDGGSMSHDALAPELMFRRDWTERADSALSDSTVVCGCGGGDAVRDALPRLLGRARRLVLDADALNAIAQDTMLQTLLRARADAGRATALTPHPLEAARLLKVTTRAVQCDRLDAAARLSREFGCVVLLKGSGTVVSAPNGIPFVNSTGNAALASAGTGDVLAGWLGGLWSQDAALAHAPASSEPSCLSSALRSAVAAAYMHGAAADAAAHAPLRASDLIEALHRRSPGSTGR